MLQTGLCDISVAAVDIAAPVVQPPPPPHVRPPKRHFTEIGDSEDEGPNSDELYGWVEDDEVAAEGLLIDDAASPDDLNTAVAEYPAESRTDTVPVRGGKQVSPRRPAPV